VKKVCILIAAAALIALPSVASAQFIGTDGFYNMNRTSGNTFTSIIGAGGTLLGTGDDSSFPFTFAAPFSYYGTPYTGGNVSTNGLIIMGTGTNTAFTNTAMTATSPNGGVAGQGALAPFWDDLYSVGGPPSGVYSLSAGNLTTLEWSEGYFPTNGQIVNVQAVFNSATGAITFKYGDISTGGGANASSATIGLNDNVSRFIQAGFNTAGTVVSNDNLLITQVVPEPTSLILCGLVGASGFARWRRRK